MMFDFICCEDSPLNALTTSDLSAVPHTVLIGTYVWINKMLFTIISRIEKNQYNLFYFLFQNTFNCMIILYFNYFILLSFVQLIYLLLSCECLAQTHFSIDKFISDLYIYSFSLYLPIYFLFLILFLHRLHNNIFSPSYSLLNFFLFQLSFFISSPQHQDLLPQ